MTISRGSVGVRGEPGRRAWRSAVLAVLVVTAPSFGGGPLEAQRARVLEDPHGAALTAEHQRLLAPPLPEARLFPLASATQQDTGQAGGERVQLTVQPDEAWAVLGVLERIAGGHAVTGEEWSGVFATEGYTRMMEREAAMDARLGVDRGFSDDRFREWAESAPAHGDLAARRATLQAWREVDVARAAARAAAYLPAHATIRGTIYPLIREQTNSFVHDLGGESPAIFMSVEPGRTAAGLEHVLAHELHHIGLVSACPVREEDIAHQILTGFGEGLAVLAAAGGPEGDTHPVEGPAARASWQNRLDSAAVDMAAFEAVMDSVFEGDLQGDDAVRSAFRFINGEGVPQGPFYSLGWLMATTIERELGRETLVNGVCCPERLFLDYDAAVSRITARDPAAAPPRWSRDFLDRLAERVGRV